VFHPAQKEGATLKVLYVLVLVLAAFAAPAQALDASAIAAGDFDDCPWEITENSTMPAPMVASELTIKNLEEEVDAAITRPAEHGVAVRTIEPGDDFQTLQDTMPARIVSSEPTITHVDDAVYEADEVAITGANDAMGVLVGSIQPGNETQAMPTQVVASEPTTNRLGEAIDETDGIVNEQALPPRD
jgi:hypothetical protein